MSIAAWATVTPNSGSGNGSTSWTGTANTQRHNTRTFNATYTAGNISRTVTVSQAGANLFITGTNPTPFTPDQQGGGTTTYSVANTGGNLTIQGLTANGGGTNATKIDYELQTATGHGITASLSIDLPANYTANGTSTAKNAAITGDPGYNTGAFDFSIPITIPANTTTDIRGCVVHITAYGDSISETVTWDITIVQAAGNAYLYVGTPSGTTATVNLSADGTPAQTVAVYSNTSWTVS